jgi:transcriptional regulator with XRE-family HTH domain
VITYKDIGARLRAAREQVGLTLEQSARVLGLTKEQLSCYENGCREISLVSLDKIANLYGCSVSHLIRGDLLETTDKLMGAFFSSTDNKEENLTDEDLRVIEWAQRFIRNKAELDELLKWKNNAGKEG